MNSQKLKVNHKSQRESNKPLLEKTKILKEINRIAGKQVAAYTNFPQKVVIRRSLPDFKQEQSKRENESRSKAFRSQASQTTLGGANDYEGIIRYPSSRRVEAKPRREVGLQVSNAQTTPRDCGGEIDNIIALAASCQPPAVNHIKLNQTPLIKPRLAPAKAKVTKPDPTRAPPTYQRGVLPRYLRKLREEDRQQKLIPRRRNSDTSVAAMDMDGEERLEKLKRISQWHQNYKNMVSELNMLSTAS